MSEIPLSHRVTEFLHTTAQRLWIGGKWSDAVSGAELASLNPATGEVIANVAAGDVQDVDRAVGAARAAFESKAWSGMTPAERERLLMRIADVMQDHAEDLAQLESLDNGKPVTAARQADVPKAIAHFRYYAGWPTKITGLTAPVSRADTFAYTRLEPVGVCGQIIPWNYPLLMASWKLAPALAAGCTVILKPAEQTPLTALYLARLLESLDMPPGVVNVVTGVGETAGVALAQHQDVDKLAFTGSTEVGRLILRYSAESNLKRVSLELGGKSPNIIFADANIEEAKIGAADGIFYNMGQDCTAGSRVFAEWSVYDEVAGYLADRAKSLRLGPGLDEATEVGPLISEEQRERVSGYVATGVREGAQVLAGGDVRPVVDEGYFATPTVFGDVGNGMTVAQEEIFGPVVAVIPFRDVQEVVAMSNRTRYGLAAGIWTRDLGRAHSVAAALKAGTVWVNTYGSTAVELPFGGFKESGHGREHGLEGIRLYSEVKSVMMNLAD